MKTGEDKTSIVFYKMIKPCYGNIVDNYSGHCSICPIREECTDKTVKGILEIVRLKRIKVDSFGVK